ncbi:MAG TPA: hypothetical protein VGO89_14735, partial [Streptomyces sp.]|nr:hypothetical protein [Streptomyces sp.]
MATAPAATPGQTRTPSGPGPTSGGGSAQQTAARRPLLSRANIPGGAASLIWLAIVLVPLWC